MKNYITSVLILLLSVTLSAQTYSWKSVPMDGSRTGCSNPSKDNIKESVGTFKGSTYVAPNGKSFGKNTTTAKVARIVLDAQPKMARVKDVIAYSSEVMVKGYPESALSNWFIDIIMSKVGELSGKRIDVGVGNFGGIRVDMPQGDVILDDMLSMFPFKNQLVYVEHRGSTVRKMLEEMAAGRFQVIGGIRVVVEDGKLVSAEIDGEPLEDDKVYGVATISFLLEGGDGLYLGRDAVDLQSYDVDVIDAVLEHVYAETAAGRPLVSRKDGRITIR